MFRKPTSRSFRCISASRPILSPSYYNERGIGVVGVCGEECETFGVVWHSRRAGDD